MYQENVYASLNKVCTLMSQNKLREDMDDSLLEKLLSIIKDGIQETDALKFEGKIDFIEKLLKCTDMLPLAQKVILSLKDKKIKLSTSVKVFTLRLLGLIFEKETVFSAQKKSALLREFSNSFKNDTSSELAPSIQDAVLSLTFSIGKHPEGATWIINENLVEYSFSSFSCSSYYVRKTAVKSFSDALILWTSSEFSSLPTTQKTILNDTIKKTVSKLICSLQLSSELADTTVNQCCILTLKQVLNSANIRNLVIEHFHLIEKIMNYIRNLSKSDILNESVLELLLELYSNDSSIKTLIIEVINHLVVYGSFVSANNLTSSFLSISKVHQPLSSGHLHLFLMPLQILSGRVSFDDNSTLFCVTQNTTNILLTSMENKSNCVKLINSGLDALCKLASVMDQKALETVLKNIEIATKGPLQQNHPMCYVCLENRSISLAILQLFSCLLIDEVYYNLNSESQLMLIEYMLCFLERPAFDSNVLLEVLKLLKCQVAMIAKYTVPLPIDLKEKFVMLVSRKLLDNKEPVVDNALHLAGEIIGEKGYELWREEVFKNSIHMIVWEIAIEGSNEGFVKASALKVIIKGCIIPCYWEDIKSTKKVNELDVLNILCRYFHNPDFFIQRESLSCINKWFQSYEQFLSQCNEKVFNILFCAVRSLDLELKLASLLMWQWLLDSSSTFTITESCDLNNYLKTLSNEKFVASLMHASEDYDEAVKFKATEILLHFRQKLILMGYNENSLCAKEQKHDVTPISPTSIENNIIEPISTAERDAGIETVLNITTTEQLTNIYYKTLEESVQYNCQCSDIPALIKSCSTLFSVKSFWTYLWSKNLDSVLYTNGKSTSIFSENSLSLLDDIIAAEETEINHCADDGLDCY